jgi:hypothetical protein
MALSELSETPLDDQHTLVRTSSNLHIRDGALRDPVTLLSTFVLRSERGEWRIVLYLNHQYLGGLFENLAGSHRT